MAHPTLALGRPFLQGQPQIDAVRRVPSAEVIQDGGTGSQRRLCISWSARTAASSPSGKARTRRPITSQMDRT